MTQRTRTVQANAIGQTCKKHETGNKASKGDKANAAEELAV